MARPNRVKFVTLSPAELTSTAGGAVSAFSDSPINGFIQGIYFQGGDYDAAGSLQVLVSGTAGGLTATEGTILYMTSGTTTTGHHMGEDWVVFPRAATVTTAGVPIGGQLNDPWAEIPVWSNIQVIGTGLGNAKSPSGLTIVYV